LLAADAASRNSAGKRLTSWPGDADREICGRDQ
jgi:hypothetical protein